MTYFTVELVEAAINVIKYVIRAATLGSVNHTGTQQTEQHNINHLGDHNMAVYR